MNLKQLTLENHKRAERSKFAGILLSGEIDPLLYFAYLCNQVQVYDALESRLPFKMLGLEQIRRKTLIGNDIIEMEKEHGFSIIDIPVLPSVVKYMECVDELESHNPRGLLAHLYVRHFGDMYGGSIIADRVPSSGSMYEFEDKEILKQRLRNLLDDDMAYDANICFEYAIELFEELGDWYESRKESSVD